MRASKERVSGGKQAASQGKAKHLDVKVKAGLDASFSHPHYKGHSEMSGDKSQPRSHRGQRSSTAIVAYWESSES